MARLFTNNAFTTLNGSILSGATSLTVATGEGARFPNPSSPDYFIATITDGTNVEIIKVTARSADSFGTIVRALEGTSARNWNSGDSVKLRITADTLTNIQQSDMEWPGQASDPATTPATGNAMVFLKKVSGRPLLKTKPADSWDTAYQPAIFQNEIFMISPSSGTTIGVLGGAVTSVGTVSHTAPTTSTGSIINQISGAVSGNTAGTGNSVAPYFRGTTVATPCGWFFTCRMYTVDASYGSGATGARFFIGLTNGTMAASVAADDPAGHCAGFTYSTNASDTTWHFNTRDGSTRNNINTTLSFAAQHWFDFYCYCGAAASTIYWRVDDITAGTSQEGSTGTNLPGTTTLLRAGLQLATLTGSARNIGYKRLYIEVDI